MPLKFRADLPIEKQGGGALVPMHEIACCCALNIARSNTAFKQLYRSVGRRLFATVLPLQFHLNFRCLSGPIDEGSLRLSRGFVKHGGHRWSRWHRRGRRVSRRTWSKRCRIVVSTEVEARGLAVVA
jgi:hypothetical protein